MDDRMSKRSFAPIIERATHDACRKLDACLLDLADAAYDYSAISEAGARALFACGESALMRVLLLEMHAARLTGVLGTGSPEEQFDQFVAYACTPAFFGHLRERYPALHTHLERVLSGRRMAMQAMFARLRADRDELEAFFGFRCDRLISIGFGLGDSHNGGHSVALLTFADGALLYKPRPMGLDVALDAFLQHVFPGSHRIRLPATLDRGTHGWSAFVRHHYCRNDDELGVFYANMGRWIAVLHLLGGTDVHYENLIAAGPLPVVVDPESMFSRVTDAPASKRGLAYDAANRLIDQSVLRTGLVPYRSAHLAFKGVDISAAGSLPEHQPEIKVPALVDGDTINARISEGTARVDASQNLPAERPVLERFWGTIIESFTATTERLRTMDGEGKLEPLLAMFRGHHVRDIRRPTQIYAELMRMLWHPASLHQPEAARQRARDLLGRSAEALSISPTQVDGEIAALCDRDIPVFGEALNESRILTTLDRWRSIPAGSQERILHGAMVAARMNGKAVEGPANIHSSRGFNDSHDVEPRRRRLAERVVRMLVDSAVRGPDGTATWISPITGAGGWKLAPLGPDMYSGIAGVAFALAGYAHEVRHDRAAEIPGIEPLLAGVLATMRLQDRDEPPTTPGGYAGLGARIWAWLCLHQLLRDDSLLDFAVRNADLLRLDAIPGGSEFDILEGWSGLVVPLLHLSEATADRQWGELAAQVGKRLEAAAVEQEQGVCWPNTVFDRPIGGFSHGASGIGWSLARLGASENGSATDRQRWSSLARRAFTFEQTLYDAGIGGWRDLRVDDASASSDAWCHGSVGIGLAAADIHARTNDPFYSSLLRLACTSAYSRGWRHSPTLCHGSLGMWELLRRQQCLDRPADASSPVSDQTLVLSIIERGLEKPDSAHPEAFMPSLMVGMAGTMHGLNRMHPECDLPSPLLMEYRNGGRAVANERVD
jgi:lantibiotic modifying enzyme